MDDHTLHASLIGQPGGRHALNTPVLIVDLDALARNINRMADYALAHRLTLRPHAKTHKSVEIATMQLEAGAAGVCCAKLGEAEALAEGGVQSILITSPVVSAPAIARLIALNNRIADLRAVVDNPDNVDALGLAASGPNRPMQLLVDIDPGIHRTGVASPEAAIALARRIAATPSLIYLGVQYYCGAQQHIETYAERAAAIEDRNALLKSILADLAREKLKPRVVTGGGTGTHRIDAVQGLFTEIQPGSYVFMDRQYNACDLTGRGDAPFETALFIDTCIISANTPGLATIDAGIKAMSTDGGPPAIASGAPQGAAYALMGDEHGLIMAEGALFQIGERVTLAAPHCDPTVNLYDFFHVARGDTLVDIWRVQGRGRSR
jgi:D-serine deaminase-like pyridoxal phosphate-dependent protein